MQRRLLPSLAALAMLLVSGRFAQVQQAGWVQLTSSRSGGLKSLPTNGNFDSNTAQASWAPHEALLKRNPEPKFVFARRAN